MINVEVSIMDVLEHDAKSPPPLVFFDRLPLWMKRWIRKLFKNRATAYELWEVVDLVRVEFEKQLMDMEAAERTTVILPEESEVWN